MIISERLSINDPVKEKIACCGISWKSRALSKVVMGVSMVILLGLSACSVLFIHLGVVGSIIGGVMGAVSVITLIVGIVTYYCGCKKFTDKMAFKKLSDEVISPSKIAFDEFQRIRLEDHLSWEEELLECQQQLRDNITVLKRVICFLKDHIPKKIEERQLLKDEYTKLERKLKQPPALSEGHVDSEEQIQRWTNDLTGFQNKQAEVEESIAVCQKELNLLTADQTVITKKSKNLKSIFKKGKKKEKKRMALEAKQLQLKELLAEKEILNNQSQLVSGYLNDDKDLSQSANQDQQDYTVRQKEIKESIQKLEEQIALERERFTELKKVSLEERRKIKIVTEDLWIIAQAKELLESIANIKVQLPELQATSIVPANITSLIESPWIEGVELVLPFPESRADRKEGLSPIPLAKRRETVIARSYEVRYQLWDPMVKDKVFVPNGPDEQAFVNEASKLLKAKGASFTKKFVRMWDGGWTDIAADFLTFKLRGKKHSDVLGLIEIIRDLVAAHDPLSVLHALITNTSLHSLFTPYVVQMLEGTKDCPLLASHIHYMLNAVASSAFIKEKQFSKGEIETFAESLGLTLQELQEKVEEGSLMTDVIVMTLSQLEKPPQGFSPTDPKPSSIREFFERVRPILNTKSIHDPIAKRVMDKVEYTFTLEQIVMLSPHFLGLLIYKIHKGLSGFKKKSLGVLAKMPGVRYPMEALISAILAHKVYSDEELTFLAQALGFSKRAFFQGAKQQQLFSMILSKLLA